MLHMGRSNSSCDELKKLPREWFRFAHVCDAEQQVPRTKEGMIRTAREERLFPGEGTIDVGGILECLPPDMPYSLEIPRATLTKAIGPEEVARLALVVSKSHLKRQARASVAQNRSSQSSLSTASRRNSNCKTGCADPARASHLLSEPRNRTLVVQRIAPITH